MHSAVDFPGTARLHVALAARDLEASRAFYEVLFGVTPAKVRPGYVKFEPRDPSVNLTLNEVEVDVDAGVDTRAVSHFGVQVKSTAAVREAIERFAAAGFATDVEEDTTCCFAVQDKVWVEDPDGNRWEVFVVTRADADPAPPPVTACCAPDPAAGG